MMAPEYERMSMLNAAIQRATGELRQPIDRVEVDGDHVICWAGTARVVMTYHYDQGGEVDPATGRFTPMPGSGRWAVKVVQGASAVKRKGLFDFLKKPG